MTIPENVTSIGISAFERCESLVFVRILGPVDTLQYTFDSCPLLQSVTLSEGTVLLEGTFQSCPRFVGLELPSTATNISNMTFKNSGIIVQSIPEGAAYIGVEAFMGCEDLEWLGLPASLTMIEKDAFFGIPSTATLVFGGTREQWERLNASGDTALPEGVNVLFNGGTN